MSLGVLSSRRVVDLFRSVEGVVCRKQRGANRYVCRDVVDMGVGTVIDFDRGEVVVRVPVELSVTDIALYPGSRGSYGYVEDFEKYVEEASGSKHASLRVFSEPEVFLDIVYDINDYDKAYRLFRKLVENKVYITTHEKVGKASIVVDDRELETDPDTIYRIFSP